VESESGKRDVVAVERRTPLVVDDAVSRKAGLRRRFTAFESAHSAFDGLDCPPNPLLNEVRSEIGFVAKAVVESAFGLGFRGDVVAIVAMPAPLAGGVGTMFELLDSLAKERIGSIGRVELDDGGTTVFHCMFTYTDDVSYTFGSRPVTVAWFASSGVGFLPDRKGRGIRLVPPVNTPTGDTSSGHQDTLNGVAV
jgi:hypothetical protein